MVRITSYGVRFIHYSHNIHIYKYIYIANLLSIFACFSMSIATSESLAAMGDLVSKLVSKHAVKNKQILDGDMVVRKRLKKAKTDKTNLREKRRLKRELLEKGRVFDGDVLVERKLSRIATRGVIQLFNAVKQHQKSIEVKMKTAKTEAQKDKVNQSIFNWLVFGFGSSQV